MVKLSKYKKCFQRILDALNLNVFTRPYGKKILLQTVIGAGLSETLSIARKFDWSKVNWKRFISVIPVPVVLTYPYF